MKLFLITLCSTLCERVSIASSSLSAAISKKSSGNKIGSRYKGNVSVDYVFQQLDLLPEGFSLPAGQEEALGNRPRDLVRPRGAYRTVRRHQCRRLLWT